MVLFFCPEEISGEANVISAERLSGQPGKTQIPITVNRCINWASAFFIKGGMKKPMMSFIKPVGAASSRKWDFIICQ